jgi:hypothetical protein
MTFDASHMIATISSGDIAQFLESGMLLCFGFSWPFSIYRTWKAKKAEGKSLVFLVIVLIGYSVGMAAKFVKAAGGAALERVTVFYAINTVLVAIDLCICLRYRSKGTSSAPAAREIISPPVE